jgi:L-2-hydroxyglutarate oxidase LhgO
MAYLDMQLLSGEEARALEPSLNCDAALLSPSTGIIDSHAYMLALRGAAECRRRSLSTRPWCAREPPPARSKPRPAARR